MGKFSLEQKIKERLKGHEVHIDKRELWKGLGIEEEKDRKAVWFWWIGGLAGLLLIAGLWFYTQEGKEVQTFSERTEITVDDRLVKTGNETSTETATSESLSEIINEAKIDLERNSSVEKGVERSTANTITNTIKSKSSVTPNRVGKRSLLSSEEQKNGNINSDGQALTPVIDNQNRVAGSDIASTNEEELTQTLDVIAIATISGIDPYLDFEREKEEMDREVTPFIEPLTSIRKFEFELYGGVGSMNRALTTEDREFEEYVFARDSVEAPLEHVGVGASLKYMLGGGFYGKAGISVNRWNEKFGYTSNSDTTFSTKDIPETITIDLQGNENITYIQGEVVTYSRIDWVRYNRLTQLDLPLTLGYEKRFQKWSVFGEASALINLKQTFTGYLYASNGEIRKDPSFFKSNIGLNLGLNAGVGYGVTPRIRARLSASYYRSLNSVWAENVMSQTYSSLGVRIGVGYLF